MKTAMLTWLLVILPSVAFATGESAPLDLTGGLGFYSLGATVAPPFVKEAAKSVFALRIAVASDLRAFRQVDVSNGKGQQVKEQIKAIKPSGGFDELDKLIVIKEIEACEGYQDPENMKVCPLFLTNLHATGFLAGDGSTLWTNAHVVEPFLNTMEKLGGPSKQEQLKAKEQILVFAFDSNQNLVLNPFLNAVTISTVPRVSTAAIMRNSFYAEDSDYMSLSLARPLGAPLRIASKNAIPGDKIFVVGGPFCTACDISEISGGADPVDFMDRSPKQNSDGIGLKLTSGVVGDIQNLLPFFQLNPAFSTIWDLKHILFMSADGVEGNSGSPVLNANGEVVAIFAGGKTRVVEGKLQHVSRAVIPPEFQKIK